MIGRGGRDSVDRVGARDAERDRERAPERDTDKHRDKDRDRAIGSRHRYYNAHILQSFFF
jgi:hypothetical protein